MKNVLYEMLLAFRVDGTLYINLLGTTYALSYYAKTKYLAY